MESMEAFLLDVDNTLADTREEKTALYQDVFNYAGGPEISKQQIRTLSSYPTKQSIEILAGTQDPKVIDPLVELAAREEFQHPELIKYPVDLEQALGELSEESKLGIVTGRTRQEMDLIMSARPVIRQLVTVRFTVDDLDDISHFKPDPWLLNRATRRLSVNPENSAYVGDSPIDAKAAKRAGMWAIWCTQFAENYPAVDADAIVMTLSDVKPAAKKLAKKKVPVT